MITDHAPSSILPSRRSSVACGEVTHTLILHCTALTDMIELTGLLAIIAPVVGAVGPAR